MKAARVNAGLTQKAVAERMRVSPNTVHFWETGKVIPKLAQFTMFASICNRTPESIIMPTKLS